MVGGLFSATLLTLAVLPAAYMLIQRVRLRDKFIALGDRCASDDGATDEPTLHEAPSPTPNA
jgi:hypothetical protein